jgi:hypothetical protein
MTRKLIAFALSFTLTLCGLATAQNQQSWGSMALMRVRAVASATVDPRWWDPYVALAPAIYLFDETSGTQAVDYSSYSKPATAFGNAAPNGTNGWYFDGTSDYIRSPTNMGISGRSNLSVSVWLKIERVQANDGWLGDYTGFFMQQNVLTGGSNAVLYAGNANDYITGSGAFETYTGMWNHVCGVFDGSQSNAQMRAKIYWNGILKASTQVTWPTNIPSGSYSNWYWGGIANLARWHKGYMRNALVYHGALSSNQVFSLYTTSRP